MASTNERAMEAFTRMGGRLTEVPAKLGARRGGWSAAALCFESSGHHSPEAAVEGLAMCFERVARELRGEER